MAGAIPSAVFLLLCCHTAGYAFVQHGPRMGLPRPAASAVGAAGGFRLRSPSWAPSPRTRSRSLLRMSEDSRKDGGKVPFRDGDPQVFKAMAKAEADAGNTTGADSLNSIADRLQSIMSRSEAKMASRLDMVEPSLEETPSGSTDAPEKRWWPFLNSMLVAKGRDVWVTSIKDGPKSARGPDSFSAGCFVSWKFRMNQLSGPMCIGLTSLAVDLDKVWSLDEYFNEALYITQNGNLYNGGQLIWERGENVRTGDTVEFTLDGDMVYVAINGEQLPATLGPITSSLRPSVLLQALDDGISLLEQNERTKEDGDKAVSASLFLSIASSLYLSSTRQLRGLGWHSHSER
jgi:hypothetical protein